MGPARSRALALPMEDRTPLRCMDACAGRSNGVDVPKEISAPCTALRVFQPAASACFCDPVLTRCAAAGTPRSPRR
jgi:hypothetical protein